MVHCGWRFVFCVYAIPAVIFGILIWIVMRETASTQATIAARRSSSKQRQKRVDEEGKPIGYWDVWKYRNIILMMATWTFNMAFLRLFTSFDTLYMAKMHQMPITTVGLIMSSFGLGVFVGAPTTRALTDHIGRKWALVLCQLLACVAAVVFATLRSGVSAPVLFALIFAAAFGGGTTPVLISVSVETVGFALAATASGSVTGVGELISGGILPVVAGGIADKIRLNATLYLAGIIFVLGAICALFVHETAPIFLEKRRGQLSPADA
jgi:predicted MFS family arabinose efflux permease